MDYGQMLRRAWDIIWEHKYLILLGVIVALTGTGTASSGINFQFDGRGFDGRFPRVPDMPQWPDLPRQWGIPTAAGILVLVLIVVAIIFGLVLWVISTLAQGGLIASVDTIAAGGSSSFGAAFRAGWQKGWRLVGIGIIPAIPALLLLVSGLALGLMFGLAGPGPRANVALGGGIALIFLALACVLIPLAVALGLLHTFAIRACMLEDLGVLAAYRRGWQVLIANIGEAIVLALIQLGIGIAIGLLSAFPGVFLALCCLLWPILLLLRGAIAAYFSTLWTLAWRAWTISPPPAVA
jgi:hypothetical protein